MNDFIHLHNHTVHSKLDGAIAAKTLFPRLKELGMDAFAKTDHGTMSGTFKFLKEANKHDIKLIAGCEFYEVNTIAEKFIGDGCDCRQVESNKKDSTPDERPDKGKQRYWHITMLSKNLEGYRQLVKLSSSANTKEAYFYKPRIDRDMMKTIIKKGDVYIGTGCAISRMSKTAMISDDIKDLEKDLDYYNEIFGGDNIFVEVMATGYEPQKEINEKLIALAEKQGLPIVCTNDAHYLTKEHARLQDLLICVATGQYINGDRKFQFEGDDYYVKTPDELREAFMKHQGLKIKDEWFSNSRIIADNCEHCDYIVEKEFKLPQFDVFKTKNFKDYSNWVIDNKEALAKLYEIDVNSIEEAVQV